MPISNETLSSSLFSQIIDTVPFVVGKIEEILFNTDDFNLEIRAIALAATLFSEGIAP